MTKSVKAYAVTTHDDPQSSGKYRAAFLTIFPRFTDGDGYERTHFQIEYQCNNRDHDTDGTERPIDTVCHAHGENYSFYYAATWRHLDFHKATPAAKIEKAMIRKIRQLGIERLPCDLERHSIALRALGYRTTRTERDDPLGCARFYLSL